MTIEEIDLERERQKLELQRLKNEVKIDAIKWTHRRIMAYMSLISIFFVTIALFTVVPESKIQILSDVATIFYFAMVSILAAYFGTSTFENVRLPDKR